MNKLSRLSRISLLLSFFFAADKVLAFGKALIFSKIVGLEGIGIFGAANNIPDYLSALLSGGALGMAFIPVLTEYLDKGERRESWELFSKIINLAFVITGFFAVIIILLADPLVKYIVAPACACPSFIQLGTNFRCHDPEPHHRASCGTDPIASLRYGAIWNGIRGDYRSIAAPAYSSAGVDSLSLPLDSCDRMEKPCSSAGIDFARTARANHGIHSSLFFDAG